MSDILLYSNFLFFKAIIGNMRVFSKNVEAGFGHFKLKTCLANMKKKLSLKIRTSEFQNISLSY